MASYGLGFHTAVVRWPYPYRAYGPKLASSSCDASGPNLIALDQGPVIWRIASWKERPRTRMKKSIALPSRLRCGHRKGRTGEKVRHDFRDSFFVLTP
jgi:hypothetical protein